MTKAARKPDAASPAPADRGAGTRRRALAAALDLFDAQGVDATTIEQVRDAAGISIGSLYHHFGSREGLVAALYDDLLARYRAVIAADFARHDAVRALLDSYVTMHIAWSMQNPAAERFLSEYRHHRAVSADDEKINRGTADFIRPLLDRLKPAVTAGILKPLPAELILSMVMGPVHSWLRLQRAGSTKLKWAPAAKLLADLIWDSIAVPPARRNLK